MNTHPQKLHSFSPWLFFLGIAALAACAAPVDLSAIEKYATTTAQAGTSFSMIAADYGASCLRTNAALDGVVSPQSQPNAPVIIGDLTLAQLADVASIEAVSLQDGYTFVPPPSTSSAPPTPITPPKDTCATAAEVGKDWQKANSTVLSYVQALGNLANVDAVPTPNPAPLATSLAKVGVSASELQASSGVLDSIAAFFIQKSAERDIRSFLEQVNPSMPGAMEALEIVDASYSIELQDEFNAVELQYGAFAQTEKNLFGRVTGSTQADIAKRAAIARGLLKKRAAVLSAIDYINSQRQASRAYGSAIEQILKTHTQLYKASQGNAKLSDYITIVKTTGAPVVSDLITLAKAVK